MLSVGSEARSEGNNKSSLLREPESMVDTNLRFRGANVKSMYDSWEDRFFFASPQLI